MRKIKKQIIVVFCIFFISISSTTNTLGINYKYSVEAGEEHMWTVVVGNDIVKLGTGSKFRVNIDDIYNGTWIEEFYTYKGTVINYSIEVYSTSYSFPKWEKPFNGSAMFFNDTTWDIFMEFTTDFEIALLGWLFFIPTPINLTWVGDYLNQTSELWFETYIISDNTLTMQNVSSSIDFAFTFNNNGTLTEYKVSSGNVIFYHLKYGNINLPTGQISFGNYFLIVIPCTILLIIIYNRQKIKKKKNYTKI